MTIRRKLQLIVYGMMAFGVSEVLIRNPLVKSLSSNSGFRSFSQSSPILSGIFLVLLGTLSVTLMQVVFRRFGVKTDEYIKAPVFFGLGMGIMELLFVMVPSLAIKMPTSFIVVSLIERILSIFLYISLSTIIYNGFSLNKVFIYSLAALLAHTIYDFMVVLMASYQINLYIIYGIWLGLNILYGYYAYKSRKKFFHVDTRWKDHNPFNDIY